MRKAILPALAICCIIFTSVLSTEATQGVKILSVVDLSHCSGKLGEFRNLAIRIDDFADPKIDELKARANDANAMAGVPGEKYGFKVELILDRQPTKEAIYTKLRSLATSVKPNDSVLINGSYHMEVAARGYEIKKRWIKPGSDEERRMSIELAKITETGTLHVSGFPKGAKVSINGNFKGRIPFVLHNIKQGRYLIEVSAKGWKTRVLWVKLGVGENKTLHVKLKPKTFDNSLGMKFVAIPAGSFMMGSPSGKKGRYRDEKQHRVSLTEGFYIQTTEVTQSQWKAVMGNNPSRFKNCFNCPVDWVSWNDVQYFIRKLNRKEGTDKYRLPTEAEWEYAARSGSRSAYSFGDNERQLSAYAWFSGNSDEKPHAVGQKKPNAWGLYDMHGNLQEWCQDWYGDYPSGFLLNPRGPSSGSYRVLRGGSWLSRPRDVRCADRSRNRPGGRFYSVGFRLLRTD